MTFLTESFNTLSIVQKQAKQVHNKLMESTTTAILVWQKEGQFDSSLQNVISLGKFVQFYNLKVVFFTQRVDFLKNEKKLK